jgi:hypothetical protein
LDPDYVASVDEVSDCLMCFFHHAL